MGIPHGVIAPGHPAQRAYIQVASIQTLARRPQCKFDWLILDEGHHGTAGTWERVVDNNPDAYILGVTATPCRLSGRGLGHLYETMVIGPSVADLVTQGFLSPARVYAPAVDIDPSLFKSLGGDWQRDELQHAMDRNTVTGCAVDHYRRLANGVPAIAFCVSIQHAEHVAEQFRAAGYKAASIDGSMSNEHRDRLISSLGSGGLNVLTSCELISEGVDVPVVGCGILLRPTKSTSLHLQQVGRCLRVAPGKTEAIILDHAGNTIRHGLPDEDRAWSLAKGLEKPEQTVRVWTCPVCYAAHRPAPECPECGYVYPAMPETEKRLPEQRDGVLREFTREERQQLIENCSSLDDYHHAARELGYKTGWAWLQWQGRRKRGGRTTGAASA